MFVRLIVILVAVCYVARMPRAYTKVAPEIRFWTKVSKGKGCWLWQAAIADTGYGIFNAGGFLVSAHRFSYVLAYGEIPDGACVMHTCDVRTCVRPDHLTVGTIADNNADMASKGRARNGRLSHEAHPLSKLTMDKVLEARSLWKNRGKIGQEASGAWTVARLAAKYGVSGTTMHAALTGKTWA